MDPDYIDYNIVTIARLLEEGVTENDIIKTCCRQTELGNAFLLLEAGKQLYKSRKESAV